MKKPFSSIYDHTQSRQLAMLIPGQLVRSRQRREKNIEERERERKKRSGTSVEFAMDEEERSGQCKRRARALAPRDAVSSRGYRQLILRFEEPRPKIGRGLNWSSGSRNRIARANAGSHL